ncbi:MAG: GGDEF domain-containing protein, partial [Solirubrobacteraceae bacterium]
MSDTTSAPMIRHVSRRELTQNRLVWLATGGMYALIAAVTIGVVMLQSGLHPHRLQVMTACVVIAAIWHLRTEPPAMDTVRNHIVIAGAWSATALGLWAFQPGGSIAIAASLFIGPLAAVRLDDRRQIAAHILAYAVFATLVGVIGKVDASTSITIILIMLGSTVLAFSCTVVLEAAEAQGDELERLVRRDPLTGVGNRRLLDERLGDEIRRHERTGRHLSL